MTALQPFTNPEFGTVRTLTIDGEPWFVGRDVAIALGYSNPRKALIDHVDDEDKNTVTNRDGTPGNPNMTVINESGLYSLIFSSKLPTANRFKRWVTSEVLPAIRKTGSYSVSPQELPERPVTRDDYMTAARILANCRNERMPLVISMLGKAGLDIGELQKHTDKTKAADEPISPKEQARLVKVLRTYKRTDAAEMVNLNVGMIYHYLSGARVPKRKRYEFMMAVLDPDGEISGNE